MSDASRGNAQSASRKPQSAFPVTPIGWWWLGMTLLLLSIGIGKSVNLLILLGYCLLAVFLLNMLVARRQSKSVRAECRLPDLVFARAPCQIEVEVRNEGAAKAAIRFFAGGPHPSPSWFVPWLARRETRSLRGDMVFGERGRHACGPVWAVSGYPFGLYQRRRRLGRGQGVVVLPALGWLHRGRLLLRLRGADVHDAEIRRKPRRHPMSQAEFHGLRPFRTGDSPRLIHWRTSARRGELMTREYEDAPGQNLIVVLDCGAGYDGEGGADPMFESAVSLAATVCWEWCRRRGDRLIVGVTGPAPVVFNDLAGRAHARRVLEALALARPTTTTNVAELLDRLAARPLPAAALVVIGVAPNRLGGILAARLRRPAVCLAADDVTDCDFYDPPP
jgi:uncharacterized protein (DUF58 family)